MKYVPTSMEKPADPDEVVGTKPSIGKVGDDRCENELPRSKSPVEISCSRTRNHDGIEVSSAWLSEKRTSTDVNQGDEHWSNKLNRVDWGSTANLHQGYQFRAPSLVRLIAFRSDLTTAERPSTRRGVANHVQWPVAGQELKWLERVANLRDFLQLVEELPCSCIVIGELC